MSTARADGWTVVLPLKRTEVAKSRLAAYAGVHRPDLARAMAVDTVRAVLACPEVSETITVTSDPVAAEEIVDVGARVVADHPCGGLNPALVHGVGHAVNDTGLCAALNADLPALQPADLAVALRAARSHPTSFVADHDGRGTTLYCATSRGAFAPRYGPHSATAHRHCGAVELPAACSLRRDVDTETDLEAALELGVGEQTLAVVGALDARPPA